MTNEKHIFLVFSSAGMMLSSFYACNAFILACLSRAPMSMFDAIVVLVLAMLIASCNHRRGWRQIYIFGIHTAGFIISAFWICHRYYGIETDFWRLGWVLEILSTVHGFAEWFVLILVLLSVAVLFFLGLRLYVKPTNSTTINHRFDLGLACFLTLLLLKLLIAVKGGVIPIAYSSIKMIVAFFILGLFSMGFVRMRSESQTSTTSYFKGAGIIVSFTAVTLMLGGGLFFLFLPELKNLAEAGSDLFKSVALPMEQYFIAIARISIKSGVRLRYGEELPAEALPVINRQEESFGVLHYLFIGITTTILLAMAAFILYGLLKWFLLKFKWLFSNTVKIKQEKGIWQLLLSCARAVKQALSIIWAKIFYPPDTTHSVEKYYRRLLRWGRFSGIDRAVSETPKEYGVRLGHRFPKIEKEIRLIIRLHDKAVYGCIFPDSLQISRAKLALRKLRNPILWLARIKSACFLQTM